VASCNLEKTQPAATEASQAPTAIPLETQVAAALAATQAAQAAIANAVSATQAAQQANTPAFTPTPALTPTQTYTLAPVVPMVTVSFNTNCRSGPTVAYDILGVMMVGEKAEVVGRSTLTDTWIIKLPSNPAITCWLWAQNATVTGNTAGLPIYAIPPTPTPKYTPTPLVDFTLSYVSTQYCVGLLNIMKFKITNTGVLTWESNQVTVTDHDTSLTWDITYDNFPYYSSSCVKSADSNLEQGEVGYTTSHGFVIDPSGHSMSATVVVCSKDGLAGTCKEKTITFTP
jgi:hypothetical protein